MSDDHEGEHGEHEHHEHEHHEHQHDHHEHEHDQENEHEHGEETGSDGPVEAPIAGSMSESLQSEERSADVATASLEVAPAEPEHPFTLAIDVGGTGLKAAVLDAQGRMVADRVRVPTTYPMPPGKFIDMIESLVRPLPEAERVSMGFPGVVRAGAVLTAPHFITESGPGSPQVTKLFNAWTGFALADQLAERLNKPARVANDADLQGLAVISEKGLELVVTLGTGVGSGLFLNGSLAPHLELAQSPFRKNQTYNEQLGDATLKRVGVSKWRKRLLEALDNFHTLVNFDTCYIGGGNARLAQGHVDERFVIVDNVAGILGGIKLWNDDANHAI